MIRPSDGCGMTVESDSAVLMARIVGRDGRAIRPADVAAIEYRLFERLRGRQRCCQAIDGHDGVALVVGDVMFDGLQTCKWSVDVAGYNFRHEIDIEWAGSVDARGRQFDICYLFTSMYGERMIIRFQLGRLSR